MLVPFLFEMSFAGSFLFILLHPAARLISWISYRDERLFNFPPGILTRLFSVIPANLPIALSLWFSSARKAKKYLHLGLSLSY
jgi:hypothetical protein